MHEVALAGEKLRIGTEVRRPIEPFWRSRKKVLAALVRVAGLTGANRRTKADGKTSMRKHGRIQTQPIEHLGHIPPSAFRLVNIGQDPLLCEIIVARARLILARAISSVA